MEASEAGGFMGVPSTQMGITVGAHHATASELPRRWRRSVFLAAGACLLLGITILMARSETGGMRPSGIYSALSANLRQTAQPPAPPYLLTDDASFRQDDIRFTWVPREERQELNMVKDVVAEAAHGEEVAVYDLIVEGYDMQMFEDKAAAHACLRKKSIVFMGDSLTRYQYLNMVNFIENGQWGGPDPQLENEFQWGGWPPFYEGTNARFNGREVCDCYREEPGYRRGNIENRYYYNEEAGVWVSFFQWFREETGHLGHGFDWLNVSLPPPRSRRAPSRRGTPKKDRLKRRMEKKTEDKNQQQQQQQRQPALRTKPSPAPPLNSPPLAAAAAPSLPPPALENIMEKGASLDATAVAATAAAAAGAAAAAAAGAAAAAEGESGHSRQLLPEQAAYVPGARKQPPLPQASAPAPVKRQPPPVAAAAAAEEANATAQQGQHHQHRSSPRQLLQEQAGCLPGACNSPPDWEYDIYDFFTHIIPKLHPDILIINSGHWARLPEKYDMPRLSEVVREAVRASGGRVIWKTTTAPREPAAFVPEDDLKEYFHGEGFSILDAGAITYAARGIETYLNETQNTHLYWDTLHFYAPVYAGLNNVLLNYMCPV